MTDSELTMIEFRQHVTDIPALIAEIRRLQADNDLLRKCSELMTTHQTEMNLALARTVEQIGPMLPGLGDEE